MPEDPTLFLIGTPIGNLEDVTYRAVRTLGELDALACEDTRRTRILLERYGIARPRTLFSLHEHNEGRAANRVVALLEEGTSVGLCSDAGMPLVSDPGFLTVRAVLEAGHRVEAIPGPTAVTSALAVSGLPTASFTFKGFAPRKSGQRRSSFARDAEQAHTLVVFESPHRLGAMLEDALEALGDRRACVCIELTKRFETVDRGFLSDLCDAYRDTVVKGEITVVIAGSHPKFRRDRPAVEPGP